MCRPASSPISPLQGSSSPPLVDEKPLLFVHSTTGSLSFPILASFPGLTQFIVGLLLTPIGESLPEAACAWIPGRSEASTSTRLEILHVKEHLANQMRIQPRSFNPESQMRSCSISERPFLPLVLEIANPLVCDTMGAARNIYKDGVDFASLALQSPDFAKLSVQPDTRPRNSVTKIRIA